MGYCIEHLPSRIAIGRETETGVTDIRIDCTDWLEKWPGMAISAMYRPPEGEPYIVLAEMIGNSLVWHVTDADTAAAGTGRLELTGIADGKRKLSALVDVQVARRLEGAAGPMPEAAKPWADEVMAAAATVEQAAQAANDAAVSAGEHAASAGEAAATAETASTAAGEAASTAETAATTAQAAAESAQEAEAKAQSAADRAEAAAGSGSGGGVQSDWNENDAASPAHVLNRPFYDASLPSVTSTGEGLTITWYKASSDVPSIEDIRIDKQVNVWVGADKLETKILSADEKGYCTSELMVVVALEDNYQCFDGAYMVTFPEKGTYFACVNGITINGIAAFGSSVPEISWDGNPGNVKKIDEKFIPDMTSVVLKSSTADSTKRFKITVDDSGTLTATEVTT